MPSAKKEPLRIDAAKFMKAWNSAKTLMAAAKALGLKPGTCRNNACRLREAGHDLKEFKRGRPRILEL